MPATTLSRSRRDLQPIDIQDPVVDHGAEREEALRRYDRLTARRA